MPRNRLMLNLLDGRLGVFDVGAVFRGESFTQDYKPKFPKIAAELVEREREATREARENLIGLVLPRARARPHRRAMIAAARREQDIQV